ncbi:MAG: hypothetical protein NUK62_05635 [Tenericutes bacterium]|nr:hypothetical protein [Mycoplasmatota bacterium]
MQQTKKHVVESLIVVSSVLLYILLYNSRLLLISWIPVDFIWRSLIYFSLISMLFVLFKLHRYKRDKQSIINEDHVRPYYFLFLGYFVINVLYTSISSVFNDYVYTFIDYMNYLIITVIAVLIIYLPSLFIEMINDSIILSSIYTFLFYVIVQVMLFLPFYLFFIVQTV